MEFFREKKGGITIEIKKICSNCRYWDWYYNNQNVEDEETGAIIAEFGNCTMNHGYERVTGKNTPACEDFETMLCTVCGEHLKLEQPVIGEQVHIVWQCPNGHTCKCDTCGAQAIISGEVS